MKKYIIEKEYKGYTISKYLKEVHGYSSRGIRSMEVFLNSKKVKTSKKVRYLNTLRVKEQQKGTNIVPKKLNLDIVFEDKDLLLVNKEPFLVTHPTTKKTDITLANGIVYYFKEKGIDLVPRFYNRLDMNTSGIIVIAKNGFSQGFLQNHGEVKKYYQTLVSGIVKEDEFIIDKKIGLSEEDAIIRVISEDGQEAKTGIKVLKRYPDKNLTLLEAELFTGRTHQIRVHLSSLGHPIIGDTLYGDGKEYKGVERQFLHSYKINFIHPSLKTRKSFEIDLAKDMIEFINNQ